MGYTQSAHDHSLFTKKQSSSFTVILIYVDDLILCGNNASEIAFVKHNLHTLFRIKDLGPLKYFLGLEVARSSNGITLSQRKYALDILADTIFLASKPVSTPIAKSTSLSKDSSGPYSDPAAFRRLIRRHSISGYCVFLGHSLVSCRSKEQNTVARSSSEAKYRALVATECELQWLTYLLDSFPISFIKPSLLYCDNNLARYIAVNSMFHERTKHIDIDCHVVRERLQARLFHLLPISTFEQFVDLFTKAFDTTTFSYLLGKLGILNIHSPA
ncbi:PREDICTED: uncharacterized protein LOC109326182 [Lupinus angustifolius]|uniref:uncharacterized protein LOC109326182 n=1 Tax=Lupinus angustifolius TaxID=3871 RepID=UPI00092E5259|nr:PREDICTED: uncharacterized protein LOC109326182 [Lupinus angustifolius]